MPLILPSYGAKCEKNPCSRSWDNGLPNFVPNWAQIEHLPRYRNFLGNANYVTFVFLLYLVLLQSLKKILRADPEIYVIYCFGPTFGHFLTFFMPWQVQNSKFSKNKKKSSRGPDFTCPYQKSWYLDVSFARNRWWQMDWRTDGWKDKSAV